MEHRWGNRIPLQREEVAVCKAGRALGRARGVDINRSGIGLECELGLHAGEMVEVQLAGWKHPVRCLVVHADKNRCGLMFLSVPEKGPWNREEQ